jgi:hypothetical protein
VHRSFSLVQPLSEGRQLWVMFAQVMLCRAPVVYPGNPSLPRHLRVRPRVGLVVRAFPGDKMCWAATLLDRVPVDEQCDSLGWAVGPRRDKQRVVREILSVARASESRRLAVRCPPHPPYAHTTTTAAAATTTITNNKNSSSSSSSST